MEAAWTSEMLLSYHTLHGVANQKITVQVIVLVRKVVCVGLKLRL